MRNRLNSEKDKRRQHYWVFQSHEIVSLWQVFQCHMAELVSLSNILGQLQSFLTRLGKQNPDALVDLNKDYLDLKYSLDRIMPDLFAMKLNVSKNHAARITMMFHRPDQAKQNNESDKIIITWEKVAVGEIREAIAQLAVSLQIELQEQICLRLSPERAGYYRIQGTFLGEQIIEKFGDLRSDAEEAGNCFALGRYTACVFHLMRMMEKMVHRLGKKRQIRINNLWKLTWGQILSQLEPKIRNMPFDTPERQRRKDRYHNCHALLVAINRSVRVPTAHGKIGEINPIYTSEQAKDIMDRVERFVKEFPRLR